MMTDMARNFVAAVVGIVLGIFFVMAAVMITFAVGGVR